MMQSEAKILTPSPALSGPLTPAISFEDVIARLPARERGAVQRHEAACEEVDPAHAELWRQMVCRLATLAPHAIRALGQHTLQFFIADGKYRQQVFALDDHRDSKLVIYGPDVLEAALKEGVLLPPPDATEPRAHAFPGGRGSLYLERIDSANTTNPDASFKFMLGWNRRALRMTLLSTATPQQIETAERLWTLAARDFPKGQVPATVR
ncbi:MAG TPA: hypothetical protein VFE47_29040 [Tepidisphaeraceae bacterium]|nr:hypothetical protein [Tepidisphaeraceae bacterium]